ncbi:uncharacterized protein LOC126986432 [Eriocheir sinensis]|uniref:uncharacterized protein LOC126986432 n=1 Tax=Eriocheir sinensis TaxID=95602 RepID=UPI0021CAAB5D|nr:uncharacterized protein LOC126986432 [Eriocheir sinensis]
MRRRHGSGRRVTPPFGGRPCREPPRMEPAEWGCLTRSPSAPAKATMLPGKIRSTLAEPQGKAGVWSIRVTKDGSGDGQLLHQPLHLLTNSPFTHQGSNDLTHTAARGRMLDRIHKRLS